MTSISRIQRPLKACFCLLPDDDDDDDDDDDELMLDAAGNRSVERIMSCAPSELINSRKSDDGMTALHIACEQGHRDIAEFLILQVQTAGLYWDLVFRRSGVGIWEVPPLYEMADPSWLG